jgi:Domain of unknown function (DUF4337)
MSGHGHVPEGGNKYVALLIAVLALFLAFSEMLGKNAEKSSMQANIEANNLWAFFQAKTIRRANATQAAEAMEVDLVGLTDDAKKAAMQGQIAKWKQLAVRLESEPDTREGRKELMGRAIEAEKKRDANNIKHEGFEVASAILQVGIVVASAMIITGVASLVYLAGFLGLAGIALMAISQFAPAILPFH